MFTQLKKTRKKIISRKEKNVHQIKENTKTIFQLSIQVTLKTILVTAV